MTSTMLKKSLLFSTILITAAFVVASHASADDRAVWVRGKIKSFECGDNCYLTIVKDKYDSGKEEYGLCHAKVCFDWWHNQEMPKSFIGRHVRIKLGIGWKVDGENEKSGYMTSFDEILFERR